MGLLVCGSRCKRREAASQVVNDTLATSRFWLEHRDKALNERQRKVMNVLLNAGPGGFEGGMSTRKYESLTSTSRATASRELIDLQAQACSRKSAAAAPRATT